MSATMVGCTRKASRLYSCNEGPQKAMSSLASSSVLWKVRGKGEGLGSRRGKNEDRHWPWPGPVSMLQTLRVSPRLWLDMGHSCFSPIWCLIVSLPSTFLDALMCPYLTGHFGGTLCLLPGRWGMPSPACTLKGQEPCTVQSTLELSYIQLMFLIWNAIYIFSQNLQCFDFHVKYWISYYFYKEDSLDSHVLFIKKKSLMENCELNVSPIF